MAEADTPLEGPARKPFAAFLQEHRNGGLHGELSDALAQLVLATLEQGKKGTLTIKVDVSPNQDGVTVTITDTVTVKPPEAPRGAGIWFADEAGNLSRRNPMQPELPLRELRQGEEERATQ
jgi:hypothetical protein